jgi:hypothetical protein
MMKPPPSPAKRLDHTQLARLPKYQNGIMSPRSIAVLVILLAILLIPLWWLQRKSDQQEASAATEKSADQGSTSGAQVAAAPAEINNPEAYGMSWGVMASDKLPPDAVWMSCHGQPRDGISQPHRDSCNPYKGDASCRLALPVLCIQKDGSTIESALGGGVSAEPLKDERQRGNISFHDSVTDGWAAGQVASTAPVAGFVLGSLQGAHARCEKELGAGWRMASFHDGQGGQAGWGFVAKRNSRLSAGQRHWVHINDQPGNCWNN